MHLATNYAGHFVLTALLLDRLAAAPEGRIINLTSFLRAFGRIRFHDLAYARWYHVVPAYSRSKLAVVLFTRGLVVTLLGTFASSDPAVSRATLMDKEKNETLVVGIGDQIKVYTT